MGPDLYSKRLIAALMVSCLLHAALVFMPYFGASTTEARLAVKGGQRPGPARILNVRLLQESGPAAAVAGNSAAGPGVTNEEPRPAAERARGIDLLPVPAPAYYTTNQLTRSPQPIAAPKLDVPEIRPIFATGKVILKLWINEFGRVVSVDVEKSEVPDALAANAAAAFGKLRFVPGEIDGRRVGVVMRVEVTYEEGTNLPP